jgi:signal transduction histidine kinase
VASASQVAATLVEIGLDRSVDGYLPLLREAKTVPVLRSAEHLSSLRQAIVIILSAVNQAYRIIFALKKYVHRDHEDKQAPVDVTDSVETVLTLYYNWIKHGVEIKKHYAPVPVIAGFQDELNQVWTNLIQNALQAMQHRGLLEVSVARDGAYVAVSIADSGPGIPTEIRKEIFKPFFTTKPPGEGSGLGLDICRKIVEKHKGRIQFGSRPGRTVFRVLLPIPPEELKMVPET